MNTPPIPRGQARFDRLSEEDKQRYLEMKHRRIRGERLSPEDFRWYSQVSYETSFVMRLKARRGARFIRRAASSVRAQSAR